MASPFRKLSPEKLVILAALALLALTLLCPFRTAVAVNSQWTQRAGLPPCFILEQPTAYDLRMALPGAPKHLLSSEIDYSRTMLCALVIMTLAGATLIGMRAMRSSLPSVPASRV